MRTVLLLLCAFWCLPAHATVLTNTSTLVNPTVVDDWSTLNYAYGADGPVYIQSLKIESLNNTQNLGAMENYIADPMTGFPDDADGYVSALNANVFQTDFLFTFPGEVHQAGLYIRAVGAFDVQALDNARNVLESDHLTFGPDIVAFRGFVGLPGFRSIRVTEMYADYYSTQFDEVQWQLVPEPSVGALLVAGAVAIVSRRKRRYVVN